MARIAGIDLPKEKPIWVALQSIYGIGSTSSKRIMAATGIAPGLRVKELSEEQVGQIRDVLDKQHTYEKPSEKERRKQREARKKREKPLRFRV